MSYRESLFPSRRQTTAFGNGSQSVKRSESVRRQSSVPQVGQRTTAVSGSLGTASKTDPRPVRNGDYLRSCSAKVEEFIRSKTSPKEVLSPKAFSSPTARDFAILWETLFHALDAKWCKRIKGKKLEDQVPIVLKGLGYSLTVSKSALSAPGSTHSWPQIVLALDWMVDMIALRSKYDADREKTWDAMETDEGDGDVLGLDLGHLFDWMTESYEKYMAFDDAAVKEIDQSLLSEIQKSQERQRIENEEKRKELGSVESEWMRMQKTPSPLAKMKTELEAMHQDEIAFQSKIKQIEEVMARLKKKSVELETEIQNRRTQITGLDKEVEALRERVSKQSVNKEDIERFLNEKQKLEQMLENAQSHKVAVERDVNSREVQRDGLLNQLEKCAHGYNNHARKLKLVPVGTKYSMGVDFAIHVHRHADRIQDLCTADHKGTIQPGLLKARESFEQKAKDLNEEVVQSNRNYSKLQEEVKKLQCQRESCLFEIQKVEQENAKYNTAKRALQTQTADQLHSLQAEIDKLHDARLEMIRSIEHRVPEAEALYQEAAKCCQREQEELTEDMIRVIQKLESVRTTSEAMLSNLHAQVEQAAHGVQQRMQD